MHKQTQNDDSTKNTPTKKNKSCLRCAVKFVLEKWKQNEKMWAKNGQLYKGWSFLSGIMRLD